MTQATWAFPLLFPSNDRLQDNTLSWLQQILKESSCKGTLKAWALVSSQLATTENDCHPVTLQRCQSYSSWLEAPTDTDTTNPSPSLAPFSNMPLITWNNFSPTKRVTRGNCTPDSRSYSHLVDTWASASTSSYSSLIQKLYNVGS